MKILLLTGKNADMKIPCLYYNEVTEVSTPVTEEQARTHDIGLSWGYRHIVKPEILKIIPIANCHIAYLPWCRGADPCLWGWVEGQHGVTVHWMDAGVDTGPIISQRRVDMNPSEHTLATSYAALQRQMGRELGFAWDSITSLAPGRPQEGTGSSHRVADSAEIRTWLHTRQGWDTPVEEFLAWHASHA